MSGEGNKTLQGGEMNLSIYINGVGGQGIGILSTILAEALVKSGYKVIGSDTHGLAQRHGSVSSVIKIGENNFYPLIDRNEADIVLSLERLEALRAVEHYLKKGGVLIYYDSVYQPVLTRMGKMKYPSEEDLTNAVEFKKAKLYKVKIPELKDYRKQNIALISKFVSLNLIENLKEEYILELIKSYVKYDLEENLSIYEKAKNI